jgi:hypothetical protein
MKTWRQLFADMDRHQDGVWGETIRLLPWNASEFDDGAPDMTRPVMTVAGILDLPAERIVPGGATAERVGASFGTRVVSAPVTLSIDGDIVRTMRLRANDRVHAIDRRSPDDWFAIEWLAPDASERYKLHLSRLGKP